MPEFTVEEWTSFKEQFISVIRFIMYCFDLCFDTFRSNPLLYAAFFFPVFAVAFFVIFDLVTGVSPFAAVMRNGRNAEGMSLIHGYSGTSGKHGNIKSQNLAVKSMQQRSEGSIKASSKSQLKSAAGKSGSSGTSTNLSGNSNSTIGYGKSNVGVDLNSKKHKRLRAKLGYLVKNESGGSKPSKSGSKNYVYNYSVSTGHSELDIDAD